MENNSEVVYLYLDDIIPNRFQPREVFNEQALKELAVSIREHGVIQPIIVRKVENKYEIIAGERRYKASTMAGLTKIPAIVKNLDDKESSKVALIENLQRKDLSPIEEARTYQKILELENNMTQEQLAATMGKTQSSVSNKLRLLALPDEIQDALLKEKISERHARSLLNIEDKNEQIKMLDKIITEKMTVRELDKEIKEMHDKENVDVITTETPSSVDTVNQISTGTQINNIDTKESDSDNMNTQDNNVNQPQDINPTSVDINKIRESAQDIISTTPQVSTNDLMKNENNQESSFKFVPSFGTTINENQNTVEPTTPSTTPNVLSQFFNPNLNVTTIKQDDNTSNDNNTNNEVKENNNIGASVSSFTPLNISQLTGVNKKDVNVAVNNIKDTVTKLKNDGYNVNIVENDEANNYKITIEIQK